MIVNILMWLILGAVAGWLAGYIVTRDTKLDIMDIVLGIIGAVVGGWVFTLITGDGLEVFSILGVIVAVIAAIILVLIYGFLVKKK